MKTEYKRDLQNNYLILEVAEADTEDGYGLRMAEQNQVKGLLPIHESKQDGKLYLHYEITSKQTLESMYEKKVMGYQDILYVLAGIRDTLEDMRKYLLSPNRLLFAPDMIYVLPGKGGLMLCYYAKENEYPITVLAEFILKKLDHRDRQAVTLGYGFFQQASSANFSLPKALGDILAVSGQAGRAAEARLTGGGNCVEPIPTRTNGGRGQIEVSSPRRTENEEYPESETVWMGDGGVEAGRSGKGGNAKEESVKRTAGMEKEPRNVWDDGESQWNTGQEAGLYEEEPQVIHRERKRKKEAETTLAERVFMKVHPAVLLTLLMLTIGMELLIAFEVLGLTEAGGCFFLILSVEILVNRKLLQKKETGKNDWQEGEEDEEYQRILREMYQNESEEDVEPIEETRCLIPEEKKEKLFLRSESQGVGQESYPDICPDEGALYIGKIHGEADVLLHSATVSRMHARLTLCEGKCLLKDMNSKNGCYVNGRRLLPHEECELQEGDKVAFAEIEYQVIKSG